MAREPAPSPECPVCFQPYDASVIVPRVLCCGHTLCDGCISTLGHLDEHNEEVRKRSLIRCPECNQRSKLEGLPKNIELLRFTEAAALGSSSTRQEAVARSRLSHSSALEGPSFVFEASVGELCRWIIPKAAAEIIHPPSGQVFLCRGVETLEYASSATFVPVGRARSMSKGDRSGLTYQRKVRSCMEGLSGHEIKDLLHLVTAQEGFFGIWMDVEQGVLYLVCKTLMVCAQQAGPLMDGCMVSLNYSFLNRAMEICEIFMQLHKQRVLAGLLTPLCLGSSEFRRVQLNVGALLTARKSIKRVMKIDGIAAAEFLPEDDTSLSLDSFFYASPELLMGMQNYAELSRCDVSCKTDTWTLGCLFCKYLLGRTPWDGFTLEKFLEEYAHGTQHAQSWIRLHLDTDTAHSESTSKDLCIEFGRKLSNCFSWSPNNRPCISEIWHLLDCIQMAPNITVGSSSSRESTVCCDAGAGSGAAATLWCLALGCTIKPAASEVSEERGTGIPSTTEKDEVAELQKSGFLEGHASEVMCLAVCGKYLLSASLDKTIRVWSLRDDTLVKTLKGHNQKVMALVTDQQMSVLISGDYGGELFAWDLESISTSCLNKWYHHQDWRYSGVASLAVSEDRQLYSGAGDKTIKVWSLQDFGLITIMEGHKGLVSSLLVDKEVLYSGSWDGTIRLWWRRDHCPLIVLNETMKLGAVLALAISDEFLLAGYQGGTLQVWKDETCINSIIAHETTISSLCSDQDKVYSGSWDGSIKAWTVNELLQNGTPIFVAKCGSAIKALACHDERVFVGLGSKTILVLARKAS